MAFAVRPDELRRSKEPAASREAVRAYWNACIHDAGVASSPVGTAAFFAELDAYRFEKLHYLPRLVDFGGYAGRRVLEIGCGVGTDLVRFARAGATVVGADLSDRGLQLARANFDAAGLHGSFVLADGVELPFPAGSFDLVYCHGVLQYAPDAAGIAREAHRLLADGGEAVFMVYNRRSWLALMAGRAGASLEHDDAPGLRLYTRREFDALLAPFSRRRIVPERFPVRSRLHRGWRGALYNRVFVRAFDLLPRRLVRPLGWHLMGFCRK